MHRIPALGLLIGLTAIAPLLAAQETPAAGIPDAAPAVPKPAPPTPTPDPETECRGQTPSFGGPGRLPGIDVRAQAGERLRQAIEPVNLHCLRYWSGFEMEVRDLPARAAFRFHPEQGVGELTYAPEHGDLGRHQATVRVRVARGGWQETSLNIEVVDEWETFFMPGVEYSAHFPHNDRDFGTLHGVAIQYLIGGWVHRNDQRGPSHGRVYVDIDLLKSTVASELGVAYALGLTLSFERNPRRRFLLPYFGFETGGLYETKRRAEETAGPDRQLHVFQVTPLAGLHLFASQSVFVNVSAGYVVPFWNVEDLRGLRVKAGINVALW